jgi:hypothetical protein
MIEFRHCKVRKQASCLHMVADVNVALGDVAGCAGIDARGSKCGRRARKGDRNRGAVRRNRCDTIAGHEIAILPGRRQDLLLQGMVSPPAEHEAAGKQQRSAERK